MSASSVIGPLVLLAATVGCSADVGRDGVVATAVATTLPLAETALDDPEEPTVASVLAPSQVSASTVAPPATPPPCDADDVELWTAAVRPTGTTVDAVIRVRNVGDDWCEPDIGRSPRLDPRIEPDVWLRPGETADLVVGQAADGCDAPVLETAIQVAVGDASVVVPSAVVSCEWWLTAFYPNDAATVPCAPADLDVVATDAVVVVRNGSAMPCLLGAPTEIDGGSPTSEAVATDPIEFFPGDVVAVGGPADVACDGMVTRTLRFGAIDGPVVSVEDVPCAVVFDAAAPRPWYGAPDGPAASLAADAGIAEVLDGLDPFSARG